MTIEVTAINGEKFRMSNVLGYSLNEGFAIVQATFGAVTNTHRYHDIRSIRVIT
jgi:hypothetical protein